MKYDDQIFRLSADAYDERTIYSDNQDEEDLKKQEYALALIVKKFQEKIRALKILPLEVEDILKVRFEKKFWTNFSDGFDEIDELLEYTNFEFFLSEYCMYLGEVEYVCNEKHCAYIEIMWDYRTYFEQLKNNPNGKKVISDRKIQEQKENKLLCELNGHNFGEWQEMPLFEITEITPRGESKIKAASWIRKCNNCGFVQTTTIKPKEIEIAELEENINCLRRELNNNIR